MRRSTVWGAVTGDRTPAPHVIDHARADPRGPYSLTYRADAASRNTATIRSDTLAAPIASTWVMSLIIGRSSCGIITSVPDQQHAEDANVNTPRYGACNETIGDRVSRAGGTARPGPIIIVCSAPGRQCRPRPRDELLPAPRLLLLQQARSAEACCANHGSAEMQAYAKAIKALGEERGARYASTRPAASTAARKAQCSSSTPRRFGTPTSTAPTSTRSSTATCSAARSSRGS